MEKYFVDYNQSLALKELGFDEPCLGFYDDQYNKDNSFYMNDSFNRNKRLIYTPAPLKSQVFEFFRDKHKYYFWIEPCSEHKLFHFNITCSPSSFTYWTIDEAKPNNGGFKSYEEAESAVIDKLIELVKNK